jgi:ubiquinone/menaquinone biosynthesis C-methylase UbiE
MTLATRSRGTFSRGLDPTVRLLNVGAGSGWPALYLAKISGCDVTMSDIPLSGLRAALAWASNDGLASRSQAVAADGARLPFADGSFDALSHSDVLCCMPEKLQMLRDCRRVACKRARMAFSVIAIAPSLEGPLRRLAIDSGPAFVDSEERLNATLSAVERGLLRREAYCAVAIG